MENAACEIARFQVQITKTDEVQGYGRCLEKIPQLKGAPVARIFKTPLMTLNATVQIQQALATNSMKQIFNKPYKR